MKTLYNILVSAFLITAVSACTDSDYGKDFDIDYPVPAIQSVTEEPMIGQEITIKGTGFASPNTVSINGISMKIVSETETEIKAILPRIFEAAPLVLKNVYMKQCLEEITILPKYPAMEEIKVLQWPSKIIRGRSVVIKGENVDLIKEVTIGESTVKVNGLTQSPGQIVVLAPKELPDATTVIVKTMYNNTISSSALPVEDPSDIFIPVDPIVLFDFEDGQTYFTKGDLAESNFTAQINRGGITPGRGQKFFSFYADNIASNWDYLGSIRITFDQPIDLAEFTDPHISFLLNSDDNVCNFQVKVVQDGKIGGSYFCNGVTGNPLDAWMLRPTKGEWQWVSARLVDLINENWGGDFVKFDPNGRIEEVELILKQVNAGYWDGTTSEGGVFVNKKFKMNLDQVMITDGAVTPVYELNNFESARTNFAGAPSDGQTADVNKISDDIVPTIAGNHYFSVIKNNSEGWKWLGTLEFKEGYDFSTISNPYLCFLVNTNNEKANLQFKFVQNGVSYGASINTTDWMFSTNGWEMMQLQLKDMQWDNWSGTSSTIDFGSTFEEITIGFSSGNVANMKYEIHLDDICISDGAMF